MACRYFRKARKKKKVKSMSTAEYHAAARGESWKFRLMGDIDECMRYAESKDEFITLMRSEGYNVRWQDSRKSITYTLPGGMKCRDDRLHDERYLKEAMEREFRIRERIVHGGIKAVESPAGFADVTQPEPHPTQGEWVELLQTLASLNRRVAAQADLLRELSQRPRTYPDTGANRGASAGCDGDTGDSPTGWETERAAYLAPAAASAAPQPGVAANPSNLVGALGGMVQLGHALERTANTPPVTDATARPVSKPAERKSCAGPEGRRPQRLRF